MPKYFLNDDDISIWKKVTETVTPIPGKLSSNRPDPSEDGPAISKNKTVKSHKTGKSAPLSGQAGRSVAPSRKPALRPADLDKVGYGGISRSDARSIKLGQAGYTRKIDLHGYRREQAKTMLFEFLRSSSDGGHRHVLVITGKGTAGKGVIKASLPVWVNEPPLSDLVIAYCRAQPRDGGDGAWYINLRTRS
jgi:DNA-nicking Smr family endonuclease